MKGREGKRNRRESAIKQFEKIVSAHKAGTELTKRVLEDKGLEDKTPEEVEKIHKKKLERAESCLENTKKLLNA